MLIKQRRFQFQQKKKVWSIAKSTNITAGKNAKKKLMRKLAFKMQCYIVKNTLHPPQIFRLRRAFYYLALSLFLFRQMP